MNKDKLHYIADKMQEILEANTNNSNLEEIKYNQDELLTLAEMLQDYLAD